MKSQVLSQRPGLRGAQAGAAETDENGRCSGWASGKRNRGRRKTKPNPQPRGGRLPVPKAPRRFVATPAFTANPEMPHLAPRGLGSRVVPGTGAAGTGNFVSPRCREPELLYQQRGGGAGAGAGRGGASALRGSRGCHVLRRVVLCGRWVGAVCSLSPGAGSWMGAQTAARDSAGGRARGQVWEWGQRDKLRPPRTPNKTRHRFLREKAGDRKGREASGSCTAWVLN